MESVWNRMEETPLWAKIQQWAATNNVHEPRAYQPVENGRISIYLDGREFTFESGGKVRDAVEHFWERLIPSRPYHHITEESRLPRKIRLVLDTGIDASTLFDEYDSDDTDSHSPTTRLYQNDPLPERIRRTSPSSEIFERQRPSTYDYGRRGAGGYRHEERSLSPPPTYQRPPSPTFKYSPPQRRRRHGLGWNKRRLDPTARMIKTTRAYLHSIHNHVDYTIDQEMEDDPVEEGFVPDNGPIIIEESDGDSDVIFLDAVKGVKHEVKEEPSAEKLVERMCESDGEGFDANAFAQGYC